MRTKRRRDNAVTGMLIVVAVLLAVLLGLIFMFRFYKLVDGHLYRKSAQTLDLTARDMTTEEFDAVQKAMPTCRIVWNVPFQGSTVASSVTTLSVTQLSDEDVSMLAYFPYLETLDGTDCTDYEALCAAQETYPNVDVLYTVTIDGTDYAQDTETVRVKNLTAEDAALLSCLPELTTLDGSDCTDYAYLAQLAAEHPEWDVQYKVKLAGETFAKTAKTVEVTGAEADELTQAMAGLTKLESLTVTDPEADAETLLALREQYPDVALHWTLSINETTYSDDAEEVDISESALSSLEDAEAIAAYFPSLTKLVMCDCTVNGEAIDNEDMSNLREKNRESYIVVWKVYCGNVEVRTDDTWFMPIQQGEYYFNDSKSANLRYCEDMLCLDLGHHRITDISFVSYMPHLKYLILTETSVQDISPLADCKELIYLELTFGIVRDLSPLLECTALEDLNMEKLWYFPDMTPLYSMTWLKNLFVSNVSDSVKSKLKESLTSTNLSFASHGASSGIGWRNLQNYYDMRDLVGMPYME